MDVLFISPGNAEKMYQDLSREYSSVEPSIWALLLAESCRSIGYQVSILDVNAEKLSSSDVLKKINEINPRLICFVVYGQNVNAGTVSMSGAVTLSKEIKENNINIPIAFIGSYVQALPLKTLKDEKSIDIVFTNEGVYALRNLLRKNKIDVNDLYDIKGIGFRRGEVSYLTPPEQLVPQNRMDIDLPGYAWDLLPYKKTPFDMYRSPLWHGNYNHSRRTPYAILYTSLGCTFKCDFCMINIINRIDNDPIGVASNYNVIRYWSPEFVNKQFDKLNSLGVSTIRIADEMFLLNPSHYIPICEQLSKKDYSKDLLLWAYSRIDTISKNPKILTLLKKSGFKWLGVGIESGNRNIRLEVSKGKFENVDIEKIIKSIHESGIEILANYLFGLPNDTMESMQQTLDLSLKLCTSGWNAYPVMSIPGSKLYRDAIETNCNVPNDYIDYAFLSYYTKPMFTKHLTAEQIIKFRDDAYCIYHTYKPFLNRIERLFGKEEVENIIKMTKIKLKRKILGD